MIEQILSKLNLDEKDIHMYLALVKLGPASAGQVARETNLPRQTVYSILQMLVAREFVEQGDKRGVKQFIADPSKLTALIDTKRRELEEQKKALEVELPKLLAAQQRREPVLTVSYYEGKAGMRRLLDSILDVYRRGRSKEFRGYGVNRFKEAMGDYFYEWAKKRFSYGVTTKLVIGQGPDDFGISSTSTILGRTIKRIEMEPQKAGIYLVDNRVYLFSFDEEVGVMVESASISQLLRAAFDDHWGKIK